MTIRRAARAGKYLVLSVAAFLSLFPLLWMFVSATNSSVDVITDESSRHPSLGESKGAARHHKYNQGFVELLSQCLRGHHCQPFRLLHRWLWL